MAQKTQVILVDDVDGSEANQTVTFALDGVSYEIDLNAHNAARLRDDFATWVGHARRSAGRRSPAKRSSGGSSTTGAARKREIAAIREWGRANGWEVSDRGRLSADLEEAYAKANG